MTAASAGLATVHPFRACGAEDFLAALHPSGFRDLRAFKAKSNDGGATTLGLPADDLDGAIAFGVLQSGTLDVYVGVASRIDATARDGDGCFELHALFADCDFKDSDEDTTRKRIAAFKFPPSAVVMSGGGLQVYWLLNEPIDLRTQRPYAKSMLRALASCIGGDTRAAEPARVLRIPGTRNHKYDPPRSVVLEMFDAGLRYGLEAFQRELPIVPAEHVRDDTPVRHGLSRDVRKSLARQWLQQADPAIEKQGGDNHTYGVCCSVAHGHDLSVDDACEVLKDWNARCNPPWSDSELRQKVRNATKSADGPRGALLTQARHTEVTVEDFFAYLPSHQYIFIPSRELWPASSVDARAPWMPGVDASGKSKPTKPSVWCDKHRAVEQMTWAPGLPVEIRDKLISEGGWIDRPGCATFNLYRPPVRSTAGDARQTDRWVNHIRYVYPNEVDHIVAWLAHRVQRPGEKINHAIVLGGLQGIGKDSLLEPVKSAIGAWNFMEVKPEHLLGRFNGYVKSVILRVSEARDLGDVDRYGFYEHLKTLTAAPPDVLRCDEKHLREHAVLNVTGLVITTNHKANGLYLPADDRRHFVAWSDLSKDDFTEDYWRDLWQWYAEGGTAHVAAFLEAYDLSRFNPKAPPRKTPAFWDLVDANRAPEDAELADALDRLTNPPAVTLQDVAAAAATPFGEWLRDRKSARQIPHRMEAAGYVPVRNDGARDGLWRVNERRQVIYARHELDVRTRLAAARELASRPAPAGDGM